MVATNPFFSFRFPPHSGSEFSYNKAFSGGGVFAKTVTGVSFEKSVSGVPPPPAHDAFVWPAYDLALLTRHSSEHQHIKLLHHAALPSRKIWPMILVAQWPLQGRHLPHLGGCWRSESIFQKWFDRVVRHAVQAILTYSYLIPHTRTAGNPPSRVRCPRMMQPCSLMVHTRTCGR